MNEINIALWSTSLTLAVIGITFGIVASINASRANQKIQNIITASFSSEKAQKLFFEDVREIGLSNFKTLSILKSEDLVFQNYDSYAATGRFIPISNVTLKILINSEYRDLTIYYLRVKKKFDKEFINIIKDLSILKTNKKIPLKMRNALKKYHQDLIKTTKVILHRYNRIVVHHQETKLK